MKRNVTSSQNSEACKTAMTQLGRMFVYIALLDLEAVINWGDRSVVADLTYHFEGGMKVLADKLVELGVVEKFIDDMQRPAYRISRTGGKLVSRYLAACADELRDGHFGKMKWDKRSKFHKAILARIA